MKSFADQKETTNCVVDVLEPDDRRRAGRHRLGRRPQIKQQRLPVPVREMAPDTGRPRRILGAGRVGIAA